MHGLRHITVPIVALSFFRLTSTSFAFLCSPCPVLRTAVQLHLRTSGTRFLSLSLHPDHRHSACAQFIKNASLDETSLTRHTNSPQHQDTILLLLPGHFPISLRHPDSRHRTNDRSHHCYSLTIPPRPLPALPFLFTHRPCLHHPPEKRTIPSASTPHVQMTRRLARSPAGSTHPSHHTKIIRIPISPSPAVVAAIIHNRPPQSRKSHRHRHNHHQPCRQSLH
jgi:hypothetical protein